VTTIQFLGEWALRSSILIVSGALLLRASRVRACRVKDPAIHLAAWTAMLCGSLAIPALTVALPKVPVAMLRSATPRVAAHPAEALAVIDHAVPVPLGAVPRHKAAVTEPFDWARAALTIYALIAGTLLLRLCAGLAMSRRLLRNSKATGQTTEGIEIRESDAVSAPVALGIARPVIVLPSDWRDWDRPKLDAVLAHERSHIRRHDPAVQLLSAIHRVLLWHSPLSWFLHRRIVRVAEEASDDAALAATRDRTAYAELLLDFMQRGVRGASWQGVAMARYGRPEERIHRILDGTTLSRGVTRWSVAAILAVGAPLAYLAAATQPQTAQTSAKSRLTFDAASVKLTKAPDGVTITGERVSARKGSGVTIPRNTGGPGTPDPGRIHYPFIGLKALLTRAWTSYHEIVGPGWLDTQIVAVDATMPPDTTKEQFQEMLRNLITERFKLKYHSAAKEVAGYTLVLAQNGPKMKESPLQNEAISELPPQRPTKGPDGFPIFPPRPGPWVVSTEVSHHRSRTIGQQQTMKDLARQLGSMLNSIVTDATGLTAKYDFTVTYAGGIEPGRAIPPSPPANAPDAEEPLPDIFSALPSQLGLKLEPKKVSVEVMVIDHIDKKPTGD
jgi:uncharacterized protein (TIGR03435 family)